MSSALALRARSFSWPISLDNAALVRSVYAAFSALARGREPSSYVAAYFDSDCEYRPVEEATPVRGHDELICWIERWLDAWDDAWDEVDEIVEVGDVVVAAVRVHGRGRRSGMEISQRLFDVHELRDGRILRMREFLDLDQALEAAGLSD